jgi:hypothetical protein
MATRQLFGRAASGAPADFRARVDAGESIDAAAPTDSGRKAAGYCCVFLAGCYVAAVVVLVAYLIVLAFR